VGGKDDVDPEKLTGVYKGCLCVCVCACRCLCASVSLAVYTCLSVSVCLSGCACACECVSVSRDQCNRLWSSMFGVRFTEERLIQVIARRC